VSPGEYGVSPGEYGVNCLAEQYGDGLA